MRIDGLVGGLLREMVMIPLLHIIKPKIDNQDCGNIHPKEVIKNNARSQDYRHSSGEVMERGHLYLVFSARKRGQETDRKEKKKLILWEGEALSENLSEKLSVTLWKKKVHRWKKAILCLEKS